MSEVTETTKKKQRVSLDQIVQLRRKGLTHAEIAQVVGCSRENVSIRLRQWEEQVPIINYYRQHKADLLDMLQAQIVSSISIDDIKRLNVRDRVIAYGVLFDKSQRLAGEADVKIDIRMITADLETLRRQKEEILKKLRSLPSETSLDTPSDFIEAEIVEEKQ